jgi:hypothetical protein
MAPAARRAKITSGLAPADEGLSISIRGHVRPGLQFSPISAAVSSPEHDPKGLHTFHCRHAECYANRRFRFRSTLPVSAPADARPLQQPTVKLFAQLASANEGLASRKAALRLLRYGGS